MCSFPKELTIEKMSGPIVQLRLHPLPHPKPNAVFNARGASKVCQTNVAT
jgi:hypothetical protein